MVISICEEDLDPAISRHNIMMAIINHIQQAISCAIRNGFLVRGAITVGKLYHTDGVIFGPALVQAFELEKQAKYPRVIVSNEIINSLQKHEAEKYLFQAIVSDEIISIIRGNEKKKYQLDNKSQFFVDYFRIVFQGYPSEDIKTLCNAIELIINKPLEREDGEILEKIEWFKRRYYEIKMEYTEYEKRKKIDEKILSQMSEQNKRLGCI